MYLSCIMAIIVCFVFIQVFGQINLLGFMDTTSIGLLVLLIVPIMLSAGLLKDLNNAFRLVFGKKKEAAMLELRRAKLAVDTMVKVSVYGSIFVTVMELVVILHQLSDLAALGPMISVALLTVLYAVIISLLLLPVGAKLEQRILEYIPSCEEKEETVQENA